MRNVVHSSQGTGCRQHHLPHPCAYCRRPATLRPKDQVSGTESRWLCHSCCFGRYDKFLWTFRSILMEGRRYQSVGLYHTSLVRYPYHLNSLHLRCATSQSQYRSCWLWHWQAPRWNEPSAATCILQGESTIFHRQPIRGSLILNGLDLICGPIPLHSLRRTHQDICFTLLSTHLPDTQIQDSPLHCWRRGSAMDSSLLLCHPFPSIADILQLDSSWYPYRLHCSLLGHCRHGHFPWPRHS